MVDERPKKMRCTGRALTQQRLSPQQPRPAPLISVSSDRPATVAAMDLGTDMDMDTMNMDPKTLPSIVAQGQPVDVLQAGGQFSGSRSTSSPASRSSINSLEDDFDESDLSGSATSYNLQSPQPRNKYPKHSLGTGIQGPDDHKQYNNNYHDGIAQTKVQLDQWSQVSDRGLGLEGQHIARVAPTIEPTHYSLVLSTDYLIERVKKDLEPNISVFFPKSEKYFLPWTVLHKVLSTNTVLRLLQILNQDGLSELDLVKLANRIAPPLSSLSTGDGVNKQYRRTFATLILVRLENTIFDFVEVALDDEKLLKVDVTLKGQVTLDGDAQPSLNVLFNSDDWSVEKIKGFKRIRWELSPTFFAVKWEPGAGGNEVENMTLAKRVRYQLRSIEEILPFEPVDREAITGGFSEVRFFCLHEDQQDLTRYTRREKDNYIAVKTLNNDRKGSDEQQKAYIDEVYVMERLASTISSPHIAKLLATIEVPRAVSHQQRSDYHLIMEAADRSLDKLWVYREWWETQSVDYPSLAKWVSRQCYGLADALSMLHNLPKQSDDRNDKTHGLHCDIKPENILHYQSWKLDPLAMPRGTVDEELGVLQLSDFGLSSFHSTMSVENQRVVGNSLDYAAPETDFLLTRSPAADVWHLGCLFMDFASWLAGGPEGYSAFCSRRLTRALRGEMCRFATFTPNKKEGSLSSSQGDETTVEVNPKVLEQATYLCRHRNSSRFIRELCHLAVNYMLVMRDTNQTQMPIEYSSEWCDGKAIKDRLTSIQVAEVLRSMAARDDDSYFAPSAVGDEFVPFEDPRWRRSSLFFNMSVKQLRAISRKVKSGFGLEEAGLTQPGVTVVKGPGAG